VPPALCEEPACFCSGDLRLAPFFFPIRDVSDISGPADFLIQWRKHAKTAQDALSVSRLASLFGQLDGDGDGQASPLELLRAAEAARLGLATKDVEVALEARPMSAMAAR